MKLIIVLILVASADLVFADKWGLGNVYPLELKNHLYGYENIDNKGDTIVLKISNTLIDWSSHSKSKFKRERFRDTSLFYYLYEDSTKIRMPVQYHINDTNYSFVFNNYLITHTNMTVRNRRVLKIFDSKGNTTDSIIGIRIHIMGLDKYNIFFKTLLLSDSGHSGKLFTSRDYKLVNGHLILLDSVYSTFFIDKSINQNNTDEYGINYADNYFLVHNNIVFLKNGLSKKLLNAPNIDKYLTVNFLNNDNQLFFVKEQEKTLTAKMPETYFGNYYFFKIDTLGNLECIYDTETLNVGNVFINEFIVYKKYLIISATFYSKSPVLNHMEPEDYPNTIFIYDYVNKKYLDKPFRIEYDKPIE